MLSFHSLPQPTSCASTTFSWSYSGPIVPLMLQITNLGVSQVAPPSTTSSLTTSSPTTSSSTTPSFSTVSYNERATPNIPISLAVTIVMNFNPIAQAYVWNSVNVSQGWYKLLSTVSSSPMSQNSSLPFFVRTGSNTSCLGLAAGIISATTSTHIPTSMTSSSRSVTSLPASNLSSTSSSKVPTIVGVTVGVAALVIGVLLVWFILTRKKKSRTNDGNNKNSINRWKGLNDSRGGFDANVPQKRFRSSRSHLTSQPASIVSEFDDGILEGEKNYDEEGVALSTLPVLHHQSSRTRPDRTYSASSSSSNLNDFGGKSSLRYSTHHSIDSSAVYPPSFTVSSRDSGQQVVAPDVLRSQSLNTTNTQYSLSNSIDPTIASSFPSPPSFVSGETKQMNRQSIGKKRKPAPVYDPSGDEPTSSSSDVFALPPLPHSTTNTDLSFPELSHKSSFGPGGIEGKQLHYLIPDMPLSQS